MIGQENRYDCDVVTGDYMLVRLDEQELMLFTMSGPRGSCVYFRDPEKIRRIALNLLDAADEMGKP